MASIEIKLITINAGRSTPASERYVQEDVGVRITSSSVVFYDPKTEDQHLCVARTDFDAIHALMAIPGLGQIVG